MPDAPRSSPVRSSEVRSPSPLLSPPVFLLSVLLLVAVMVVVSVPSHAALPYTERMIDKVAASDYPNFLDADPGDVNGDGDTDVVGALTTRGGDTVVWYENLGTDTAFTQHEIDTSGVKIVEAIDFNEDGHLDVVAGDDGSIRWYENDGSQNFTEHTISSGGARDLEVLDFNRDGPLDVIVATEDGTDEFVWLENDGTDESFTRHTIGSARGDTAVDVADVDGDGFLDVATAARKADEFAWYENDGTHTGFTKHIIASGEPEADTPVDIEMTDMNGDGRLDAVLLTSAHWYLGNCGKLDGIEYTDGGFVAVELKGEQDTAFKRVYQYGIGEIYQELETGDLDRDGAPDVLAVDMLDTCDGKGGGYEWHENQGDNQYKAHTIQYERLAYKLALTDFDGRKGPDVLAVRRGPDDPSEFKWFENTSFFPRADFSYSPERPSPGETVQFTDQSSDSDGTIEQWQWDFGDGTTSTVQNPQHAYDTAASYSVTLTVTDSDSATDKTVQTVQVPNLIVDDDGAAKLSTLDCSASKSAPTEVQRALDFAPSGDTVHVCPGTYTENVVVDTPGVAVVSVGDSTNTHLRAADTSAPVLAVQNVQGGLLEGLGLEGSHFQISGSKDVRVRGNHFSAADTALVLDAADTNRIVSNRFSVEAWSISAPADNDPDSRAIQLEGASRNLIEDNRITGYDIGLQLRGHSDTNVVRHNRIDTNWVGVVFTHSLGKEPRDNRLSLNTIRVSNTGIYIWGETADTPILNEATGNDIVGNFEGVQNSTLRIFDARDNWWGDKQGPSGGAVDPFTGAVADGQGDSIVWTPDGTDTNVAFDKYSRNANVGDGSLGSVTQGCVIERTVPVDWTESLRSLRDRLMRTAPGRVMTREYYVWF